jgi:uncharacterized protein YyaL (SSP411 family)
MTSADAGFRFSPRANRAREVRWRPWGEAAFEEARRDGKPIALVVTAFWCGFCQRMDETSFSEDEVITLLNGLFVPVRLEEAQRPDVDLRYNQEGGWPSITFLTPGGIRLAQANYLPPEEFAGLLVRVVDYWQRNRDGLAALEGDGEVEAEQSLPAHPAPLGPNLVAEIAGMLEGLADAEYGGFGGEIKLLHTEANDFLLYLYETAGDPWYLDHVLLTLRRLRESRTFDARDGGFYRYSSRRDWQEPHPEKLLADQARLLGNYLHAYRLGGDASLRQVAEGLVIYLDTTLSDARSYPFFRGCQDYVRFEIEGGGEMRSLIDDCLYCDANADTAVALFEAANVLGDDAHRERGLALADGLWQRFREPDGGFHHYIDGRGGHAPGRALLAAFESTGDGEHLQRAREVAAYIQGRHRSPRGGFFDIREPGPGALRRPLRILPQNARAAMFFAGLHRLSGDASYREAGLHALRPFPDGHRRQGAFAAGFGHALALLLES